MSNIGERCCLLVNNDESWCLMKFVESFVFSGECWCLIMNISIYLIMKICVCVDVEDEWCLMVNDEECWKALMLEYWCLMMNVRECWCLLVNIVCRSSRTSNLTLSVVMLLVRLPFQDCELIKA